MCVYCRGKTSRGINTKMLKIVGFFLLIRFQVILLYCFFFLRFIFNYKCLYLHISEAKKRVLGPLNWSYGLWVGSGK